MEYVGVYKETRDLVICTYDDNNEYVYYMIYAATSAICFTSMYRKWLL